MLKKLFVLLLCTLSFFGCASDEEPDPKEAGVPATAPASEPVANYGEGFASLEGTGNDTWRWMGAIGSVKLKNTGKDMLLRLVFEIPADRIKTPPTVTVTFNGEQLDQITAGPRVEKEYTITAAQQGSGAQSELRMATNKTFVPKAFDPKSTDDRALGLSLRSLKWEAK